MLAVQPYWEVTMQHGEETSRLLTTTFSTFLSKMSFITLHRLKLGLVRLLLLLLLLVLGKLKTLLGDADKALSVELLELLHHVLIDWLGHVEALQPALLQRLNEGGGSNDILALAGDVLLVLLHPGDVVVEGAHLVPT